MFFILSSISSGPEIQVKYQDFETYTDIQTLVFNIRSLLKFQHISICLYICISPEKLVIYQDSQYKDNNTYVILVDFYKFYVLRVCINRKLVFQHLCITRILVIYQLLPYKCTDKLVFLIYFFNFYV